jgi:hypothetical protein
VLCCIHGQKKSNEDWSTWFAHKCLDTINQGGQRHEAIVSLFTLGYSHLLSKREFYRAPHNSARKLMATRGDEVAATFTGPYNHGFQLGQNYGSVSYTTNVSQTGMKPSPSCSIHAKHMLPLAALLHPRPQPSSTVPFRRDPDYVQRDVFDKLWRRRMEPASRVALVGLGGVG